MDRGQMLNSANIAESYAGVENGELVINSYSSLRAGQRVWP